MANRGGWLFGCNRRFNARSLGDRRGLFRHCDHFRQFGWHRFVPEHVPKPTLNLRLRRMSNLRLTRILYRLFHRQSEEDSIDTGLQHCLFLPPFLLMRILFEFQVHSR